MEAELVLLVSVVMVELVFVPSTFSLMFTLVFTFQNLDRPGSDSYSYVIIV